MDALLLSPSLFTSPRWFLLPPPQHRTMCFVTHLGLKEKVPDLNDKRRFLCMFTKCGAFILRIGMGVLFLLFCVFSCKDQVDWPGKEQQEVEGELGQKETRTFDSMVEEEESSITRMRWLRVRSLTAVRHQLKTN